MATTVAEIMTRDPVTIEADQPVIEAARRMRGADAGNVIVLDQGRVDGILTDRDIALRVVAEGLDPAGTPARDVYSRDLTTVAPDTSIDQAVQLIRANAVRRLPVVEKGQLVGVLSIGDLAIERDEDSALGQISAAVGND
ncbi:CBS domain-containing protein [Parafrankia sp. FMc2]|uniref:CBS domain-containing protein n=1 Tax=Parafrankia sp. FMc2 TaxID=3233196 RepID=UPI0034D49BCF